MYGLIRLFLGIVCFGLVYYLLHHTNLNNKKRFIISALAASAFMVIASFVPFENCFHTFSTPQEAFQYSVYGKTEVKLVVEGESTDLVIGKKITTNTQLIIPKTEKGWYIGLGGDMRTVSNQVDNGIRTHIYQYKDSNEYYISIRHIEGVELEIRDNHGTTFASLDTDESSKKYMTYYAYIPNYGVDYDVVVTKPKSDDNALS